MDKNETMYYLNEMKTAIEEILAGGDMPLESRHRSVIQMAKMTYARRVMDEMEFFIYKGEYSDVESSCKTIMGIVKD
jgi:hypothetical protein